MGLKTENTDGQEKMTSKERSLPQVCAHTRENNDDGSTDVDLIGSTENLSSNLPSELVTPPRPVLEHPVHVRNSQDRPHSAHVHRVCGLLLRNMGDQYQCNSCGRTLRTLGDEMSTLYNMRRAPKLVLYTTGKVSITKLKQCALCREELEQCLLANKSDLIVYVWKDSGCK